MSEPQVPHDKDLVIKSFFQALKVTFKTASMYKLDHPAFLNAVTDFQKKAEAVFFHVNPLSIGFTPGSVYLDGKFWDEEKVYQELGRLFHFRKIKSLEIRPGLTAEEMFRFASKITLPLKTIFKQGGPAEILKRENITHILIEELDYGQVLKGEGEEIADVWTYLMEEALEDEDAEKLSEITESFEHVIGKFNTDELVVNEELQKNFSRFFDHLKETEEGKYRQCAKLLVKSVVNNRKVGHEAKFENLKLLVSGLQEKDLADTLWDEIIGDVRFDALSFNVFAHLVEKDRHQKISTSLFDLFRGSNPANRKPEVEQKIRGLLSGRMSQLLPDVYRETLSRLLKETTFDQPLKFSHDEMRKSYWFTLLNVFDWEKTPEASEEALARIETEWEAVTEVKDYEFIRGLLDALNKKQELLGGRESFGEFAARVKEFIETSILSGETDPVLEEFIPRLEKTAFGLREYLDRIFSGDGLTPITLRLFFKFFKEYIFLLLRKLETKRGRPEFLAKAVESLQPIDSNMALVVLKKIYAVGRREIKLKTLDVMKDQSEADERFLISLLRSKDPEIQEKALDLLDRSEEMRRKGLRKMFDIESPFGIRNKSLLQSIRLAEKKGTRAAEDMIRLVGQRKGFWNRKLRREAERVLEKWND